LSCSFDRAWQAIGCGSQDVQRLPTNSGVEATMAVCGIVGNAATAGVQGQYQRVQNPFKKFCHELQIGNTKAQTDSVSLSQNFKAQFDAGGPVGQMLNRIGQALQAGDLTSAQNAFNPTSKVGPCAVPKGSPVPPMAGELAKGITALGEALKAGDLSLAQQVCTAAQQVWQQMSGDGATIGRTLWNSSGISVHL
jgi:hypothetical protein